MGSYLSEPITEKISSDEANDKLNAGASSMQGWRVSQEDAHNCLLDFDVNTSLFAVYDGHGGQEVALYCSQKLPQYIKDTEAYKKKEFENALIDAFLEFDATIATPDVVEELKQLVGVKETDNESGTSDIEEENVNNLYAEATMPLEQVIEKYTSNLKHPCVHSLQKDCEKLPVSPYLRGRKDPPNNEGCSSSISNVLKQTELDSAAGSSCVDNEKSNKPAEVKKKDDVPDEKNGLSKKMEIDEQPDSTEVIKENVNKEAVDLDSKNSEVDKGASGEITQNGVIEMPKKVDEELITTPQENGDVSIKGKGGKSTVKTKGVPKTLEKKKQPLRNAKTLYNKLLEFGSESDSDEDEEDKTFQEPIEDSSSDEDDNDKSLIDEDSDATSEEADDEQDEEDIEEEEDLDEEEEMDQANLEFARNMREEPGSDSGCTAVVALLHENQLFVANAGDSRCIVCRNGKAVEMSVDHKPEDEAERVRVVKAGGVVTLDGRVNGGLNLSRAIGDHAYKQEKSLSPSEQMITALPDVRSLIINPAEDEFMVLACDGIWNFMSSQQVVDFVKPRIQNNSDKLSRICEEMFEHCLAPDTLGDGTGCDNMTAIIVQFKNNLCKRAASLDETEEPGSSKRVKTDESVSQTKASTVA